MLIYGVGLILVLLSCCGLIVDLGTFELTRLQMQNAADAAALGAELSVKGGGLASAGLLEAAQNGFTNGVNGVTVTIVTPPAAGSYTGSTNAIQAVVTKQVSGMFLRNNLTLKAQATAFGVATPCVYFMNQASGTTTLNAINQTIVASCPFYIGRNYYFNGGSSSSGSQFFVASAAANSSGSISPSAAFGAPTLSDPLAYLAPPAIGACTYTNLTVSAKTTLLPGVYCGGLTITTSATVTLSPGTYIVLGSLFINGPTLNGAGVTFYISQAYGYTAGPSMIENVNQTMSAPTTGALQGILYYSDRTLPAGQVSLTMQYWNPGSRTDGIFYMYGQALTVVCNLQPINYLGVVADHIQINNAGFAAAANYSTLANGNPFRPNGGGAGLVE